MSSGSNSVEELRSLVDVDPRRALDEVRARLDDTGVDAAEAAALWWVAGLAERLLGDTVRARASLEEAVERARCCDDRRLVARVTISLAFDVGDVRAALEMLDAVEADVDEVDHPVLATQRGLLEYRLGRIAAAVEALRTAAALAARTADVTAELKALCNLGGIETIRGDFDTAREHLLRAVTLAFELQQVSWGAMALANLAYVETVEGNLPEALDAFASAEDGYRRTGSQAEMPRLYGDHAAALADANLLDDAEELIDRAVALSAASGNDLEHAELLLVSAEIDLAHGKPDEAHVSATDAVAAFTRQGRESWLHVAERLRLRAEARLSPDEPGIAEGLVMNGRALTAGGWRSDALSSALLAALLYADQGRPC
jgi:tetratricopeptide (TPR) repeat protein